MNKTNILDIIETNFSIYTGMNANAFCNQYFVLKIKDFGENKQEQYSSGIYYSVHGGYSKSGFKFKHDH